jgi:hypothetical protein
MATTKKPKSIRTKRSQVNKVLIVYRAAEQIIFPLGYHYHDNLYKAAVEFHESFQLSTPKPILSDRFMIPLLAPTSNPFNDDLLKNIISSHEARLKSYSKLQFETRLLIEKIEFDENFVFEHAKHLELTVLTDLSENISF